MIGLQKTIPLLLLLIGFFQPSRAVNPIIQTCYTADAACLVYKDTFFLNVGRDQASPTGGWFSMKEWRVYSSVDMVNWTDRGACLKTTDFSWSSGDAWASQCVRSDGKYYWYVSTSHKEKGGKAIGVAVGDSPTGPFKDAIGAALITTDMTPGKGAFDDIDPTVFVDDDGQAYLYWGNGTCKFVKLNPDKISFSGEIVYPNVPRFGEAPWLQKINDLYYLSYSSNSPSTIEYCTAPSPTGPWTYRGRILNVVENCPTSHQAIAEFKGHWYFIYHDGSLPGGNGFHRSVRMEEFTLGADGSIPLLNSTREGVRQSLKPLNPFQQTEAETMAWSSGLETASEYLTGVYVTGVDNGDFLQIRSVNFNRKPKSFTARVASVEGGCLEIRTDSINGKVLGTCQVPAAQGSRTWTNVSCKVGKIIGLHDLFFVFKGGKGKLFDYDKGQFH